MFGDDKYITCSQYRNQGQAVWFLPCRSGCLPRTPIEFHPHESAIRHLRCRHFPETPNSVWTRLWKSGKLFDESNCHWISLFFLPVLTSHSLTVPSSEDVITNLLLNWRHVTADWCLLAPINISNFQDKKNLENRITSNVENGENESDLKVFEGICHWWCPTLWRSNRRSLRRGCYSAIPFRTWATGGPLKCACMRQSLRPTPGCLYPAIRSPHELHQTTTRPNK